MPVPTLTPRAQAVVTAFGAKPGVTVDHQTNLEAVIRASPALIDQINAAVALGHLSRILPLSNPNAGGEYDARSLEMRLPLGPLATPPPGTQQVVQSAANASEVTFVLGHELQHGFNRTATRQAYETFAANVKSVAKGGASLRDYTAPTAALLWQNRRDEASAEIAGWNAVVSRLRNQNQNPSIRDIFEANPGRMADFISVSGTSYMLKPNLVVNADKTLPLTSANLEAMGKYYFDKPARNPGGLGARGNSDYANYYGAYAVGVIARLDRHHNLSAASSVAPQLGFDLARLRLDEKLMEENGIDLGKNVKPLSYYDLSKQPPTAHLFQDTDTTHKHISPIGAEALDAELARLHGSQQDRTAEGSGLSVRSSPDDALLQKLRECVRALDQQADKPWDDASERLSASALLMARENGFTAQDELRLALNLPSERHAGGEVLHLVREGAGISPDPAANRVHMSTADALSMPADERLRQVEAVERQQAQESTQRLQQASNAEVERRSGAVLQL